MLEISAVEPLHDRVVRLTLSNGSVVVRDLGDVLDGRGVFARITADDAAFREVYAAYGTIVWPGEVDLAPETLIWDGPTPADEATRKPAPFLRIRRPPMAYATPVEAGPRDDIADMAPDYFFADMPPLDPGRG
ncbi:MAG: DUF2442 domain-containing protein [Candidatus Limnocylindrales bacterium]